MNLPVSNAADKKKFYFFPFLLHLNSGLAGIYKTFYQCVREVSYRFHFLLLISRKNYSHFSHGFQSSSKINEKGFYVISVFLTAFDKRLHVKEAF